MNRSWTFNQCSQSINMKHITLTLLCLSALALSASVNGQTSDKPAVDNSAKNERDASGDTKTSGDQSNKPEDIKITAAIRRAIVADDSLTMTASNVKIITADGVVTLRGPVKTAAEKTKIASIAHREAGKMKIDDQLEIKESK